MKSMKRIFGRITIALLLCAMMPLLTMPVCADSWIYTQYNGRACYYISEVDSNKHKYARLVSVSFPYTDSFELPETLDNLPVEIIGDGNSKIGSSDVKKLTIPDSVKRIEKNSFQYLNNLETVIIGPNGNSQLKYVDREAFRTQKNKRIKITATNVPSFDNYAFRSGDQFYVPENMQSEYATALHASGSDVHSLEKFTGSMFSTGNVIIITAGGVIAIAAIALLVLRKRKKNA